MANSQDLGFTFPVLQSTVPPTNPDMLWSRLDMPTPHPLYYYGGATPISNPGNWFPLIGASSINGYEFYFETIGTDTYTTFLSISPQATSPVTAYIKGQLFKVKFGNANTGPVTLEVDTTGIALPLLKQVSQPLVAGDILAGEMILVLYDGVNLQAIGKIGATTLPTGTLEGQTLRWNNALQLWVISDTVNVDGTAIGDYKYEGVAATPDSKILITGTPLSGVYRQTVYADSATLNDYAEFVLSRLNQTNVDFSLTSLNTSLVRYAKLISDISNLTLKVYLGEILNTSGFITYGPNGCGLYGNFDGNTGDVPSIWVSSDGTYSVSVSRFSGSTSLATTYSITNNLSNTGTFDASCYWSGFQTPTSKLLSFSSFISSDIGLIVNTSTASQFYGCSFISIGLELGTNPYSYNFYNLNRDAESTLFTSTLCRVGGDVKNIAVPVATVSRPNPYELISYDDVIVISAAQNITLPTTPYNGQYYTIIDRKTTGTTVITADALDSIYDAKTGLSTASISRTGALVLNLIYNQTDTTWYIEGEMFPPVPPPVPPSPSFTTTSPVSYPYTVLPADSIILVDTSVAANTITLEASPATNRYLTIKDKSGNANAFNITYDGNGNNIDGLPTRVINVDYGSVTMVFDGLDWYKL